MSAVWLPDFQICGTRTQTHFPNFVNTPPSIAHCIGNGKTTILLISSSSFVSVWRRSWRGHARQTEATRYTCCSVLTRTTETLHCPTENDEKLLPSSQKETKSSTPLNDKEAESSKGKQNINHDKSYKASSRAGQEIITRCKPLICREIQNKVVTLWPTGIRNPLPCVFLFLTATITKSTQWTPDSWYCTSAHYPSLELISDTLLHLSLLISYTSSLLCNEPHICLQSCFQCESGSLGSIWYKEVIRSYLCLISCTAADLVLLLCTIGPMCVCL